MSLAPFDLLDLTCRSLRGNLLRSALATLGVFMGVAAVSATLQVGSISRAVIAEQLQKRDPPQVTVGLLWGAGTKADNQLHLDDLTFLKQRLVGLKAVSALNWIGPARTVFQDRQLEAFVLGVSPDFLRTQGRTMAAGRFFTAADFETYRPVVVIDRFLAEQLFAAQPPVGERLYVNSRPYIVVGVVPTKLDDRGPPGGQVWLPMSAQSALTGRQEIGGIQLSARNLAELENLGEQAKQLLAQRQPGRKLWDRNNVEDILQQQQTLTLASRALTLVGLVSLLISGVGIANILIASVVERTPEIGLRRALGATRQEIMLQFVLEATLLSLIGGTAAIVSVHGLTRVVADRFQLPYRFEVNTAALALGSALGVGIGASLVPALRASQLDPVKALRSE